MFIFLYSTLSLFIVFTFELHKIDINSMVDEPKGQGQSESQKVDDKVKAKCQNHGSQNGERGTWQWLGVMFH